MIDSAWFIAMKEWLGVGASIATCIASVSVIIALVVLLKNKVSKKSVQVDFQLGNIHPYDGFVEIVATIDVLNFTDKEFSISECFLHYGEKSFQMKTKEKFLSTLRTYVPMKNLIVAAHESQTFFPVYFEVDALPPESARLEVKTTIKTLFYNVSLRKKMSSPDSANQPIHLT